MLNWLKGFALRVYEGVKSFFVNLGNNIKSAWENHKTFMTFFAFLILGAFFSSLIAEIVFLLVYFAMWVWAITECMNMFRSLAFKQS